MLANKTSSPSHSSSEIHIASAVVHVHAHAIDAVTRALTAMPGAQVHGANQNGQLVLTIEGGSASDVIQQLSAVQALPDVVYTALVYQHHEHLDSSNGDDSNETDSSRIH
jgi:periplasmic nitrate reductase NapD